eukprot:COSAG02_NODE_2934_length_7705_cov_11.991191_6_plen_184_part_00
MLVEYPRGYRSLAQSLSYSHRSFRQAIAICSYSMGKDWDAGMAGELARQNAARKKRDKAMLAKGGPGAPIKKKVSKKNNKLPVKGTSRRTFDMEDNMALALATSEQRRKNFFAGGRHPELNLALHQLQEKEAASSKPKKLSTAMRKKIQSAMMRASGHEFMLLEEAMRTGVVPDDPFLQRLLQ